MKEFTRHDAIMLLIGLIKKYADEGKVQDFTHLGVHALYLVGVGKEELELAVRDAPFLTLPEGE